MKNKQGNAAIIALIVIIIAITAGVMGWMFAKKTQQPMQWDVASKNVPDTQKREGESQTLQSLAGDFGPYVYNKASSANVAVSNKIRAIAYQEGENGYVIVNDKKFGPYSGSVRDLKVSDNFWGFIVYGNDGTNMLTSKKIVTINGNQTELDNKSNNVYFDFSDMKNSWGIRYDDMSDGGRSKFIVNGEASTEGSYEGLNKIVPYQKDDTGSFDYYVKVDGKEYQIGGSGLSRCLSYSKDRWGCSVEDEKDGTWHIFIYDNGVKKEYGPYGKFTDPREVSEFKIAQNGFIFCSSKLAVINKDGMDKSYNGFDIYQCNDSGINFGFNYGTDKNGNERFVNVNGATYGPYSQIDNFSLVGAGWGFSGWNDKTEETKYIINGNVVSDVNVITGPAISDNYWAIGYEKDGKLYMRVGTNNK